MRSAVDIPALQGLRGCQLKDIYLGRGGAWLAGVPGTLDPTPAPDEYLDEVNSLRVACDAQASSGREEWTLRHNEVTYRVSVLRSMSDVVYVLRRFPSSVPFLESLRIPRKYVSYFMTKGMSGLIIIAGAFGQGKTTTASAIVAGRLKEYGGVAITIEEPPEMPLEGKHGQGICYQTWVERGGFGDACRKAARWAPSMIFLGEVRDSETAAEALRASINGRLIICTVHADSVSMAIERMYSLANGATGSSEDTSSLLANGLSCVMHQALEGGETKYLRTEFLWLLGENSHGIRSKIRGRGFAHLKSEVDQQQNSIHGISPERRT